MRQIGLVRRLCTVLALGAATAALVGASAAPAGAAGSNSLNVKAGEYTYRLSGSPKAGWVQINFDNAGVEYHVFSLVKLKSGVTTKQFKNAALSDDDAAFEAIVEGDGTVGPQTGLLSPGENTSVITKLAAGRYGAICQIPTPEGEPHFLHGMLTTFDVRPGKSSLTPPQDGVVDVTIADDGITLPSTGLPRNGWAKVTNSTTVQRDLILAHYLTPDATYETADAYFDAFFQGQADSDPPASLQGGLDSIPPGGSAYFELTLKSGPYVLVSQNQELDDDPNEIHVDFTIK
jgi:hypothetical protein